MSETNGMPSAEISEIMKVLGSEFPNVAAYRYNSASLRVRIIDDRFRGMNFLERDQLVEPLLKKLPESIQDDILILLLLTTKEKNRSLLSLEFEALSPSRV